MAGMPSFATLGAVTPSSAAGEDRGQADGSADLGYRADHGGRRGRQLTRQRPEGRANSTTSSASSDTTDSSWNTTAAVVALDSADDYHFNRPHGDGGSSDRAGESSWGEHGAGGSWSEAGDSGGEDGGGGDDGGGDGGDSGGGGDSSD